MSALPPNVERMRANEDRFFSSRKQCESPECPWCARTFLTWLKLRTGQMNQVQDGMTRSFSECAASSNVPR